MLVLGIDPGSRYTGYGLIDTKLVQPRYVASGLIRLTQSAHVERLAQIYAGLSEIISTYQPEVAAVEQVFMAKNVAGILKLGQARGSALVCLANHGIEIHEYAATLVKQSITGQGRASKAAIQKMVIQILSLSKAPPADAADALAIALTHCYAHRGMIHSHRTHSARRLHQRSWRRYPQKQS